MTKIQKLNKKLAYRCHKSTFGNKFHCVEKIEVLNNGIK